MRASDPITRWPTGYGRRLTALLALLWLVFLPAAAVHAEKVYVYRDAQGQFWFTDQPVAPKPYHLESVRYYGRPPAWRSCMGLTKGDVAVRAKRYLPAIETFASQYGVAARLVRAVISVESCFDPRAVSSVGARGLMQLMPSTARHFGINDLFQPQENLRAGVHYLANLIRRYRGNLRLALAAYNAGPGAVYKYRGMPPYPQTRSFVRRVLADYRS